MNRDNDFQARMAQGKANAARDRDRGIGGGTVRVYATTNAALHALGRIESDNFDVWLAAVKGRMAQIVEDSRFEIYGEKWEGFDL